jgi:hypothetical protein
LQFIKGLIRLSRISRTVAVTFRLSPGFVTGFRQKRDREFATAPAQSCTTGVLHPYRLYRGNLVNSPSTVCTVDGAARRRASVTQRHHLSRISGFWNGRLPDAYGALRTVAVTFRLSPVFSFLLFCSQLRERRMDGADVTLWSGSYEGLKLWNSASSVAVSR